MFCISIRMPIFFAHKLWQRRAISLIHIQLLTSCVTEEDSGRPEGWHDSSRFTSSRLFHTDAKRPKLYVHPCGIRKHRCKLMVAVALNESDSIWRTSDAQLCCALYRAGLHGTAISRIWTTFLMTHVTHQAILLLFILYYYYSCYCYYKATSLNQWAVQCMRAFWGLLFATFFIGLSTLAEVLSETSWDR
jgi:hypothetical protein